MEKQDIMFKDGVHKIVPKSKSAALREQGWKTRNSVAPLMKSLREQVRKKAAPAKKSKKALDALKKNAPTMVGPKAKEGDKKKTGGAPLSLTQLKSERKTLVGWRDKMVTAIKKGRLRPNGDMAKAKEKAQDVVDDLNSRIADVDKKILRASK
jgi:hypothetical protein